MRRSTWSPAAAEIPEQASQVSRFRSALVKQCSFLRWLSLKTAVVKFFSCPYVFVGTENLNYSVSKREK